ncbi:Wzz/FepE/Etk N-terminal domain-containing protein [Aeromonas hydrophila]|nr:Wzz/FepE/Etk N-terminal domain-containing protein [Aeromonas hydrophila]
MNEKTPSIPNQWVQEPKSKEIDLRELMVVLWRQKLLIALIAGVFAVGGISYALLAPQLWSAKAVITEPKPEDLQPMQKVRGVLWWSCWPPCLAVC